MGSVVSASWARHTLLGVTVALLVGGGVWLIGCTPPHGATLEPRRLTLEAGETIDVTLRLDESDVVAVRFRLRYDEDILTVDGAHPEQPSMLAGGNAIHLPPERSPGRLDVPGLAVIGGRTFAPGAPIYHFTLRGASAGSTTLAIEDLTIVDATERQRRVHVPPCHVTVSAS